MHAVATAVKGRHTHRVSGITHNMSDNPLIGIFSSRTIVKLLGLFLMNPERSYYQQELVRQTGAPLRPVQLAVAKLTSANLVRARREGKQVYYQAVPENPIFGDLRAVFEKTFALADVLLDALKPVASGIEVAFVYGSSASAEQKATSDVDLLIVGAAGRRDVAAALAVSEARLGREINLSLYDAQRFSAARVAGDPFLLDVLAKPKVWVVGDDAELERLAC